MGNRLLQLHRGREAAVERDGWRRGYRRIDR